MTFRRALAVLTLSVAGLASCGPAATDPGPGGVTVGEARALDEAAAMIDERRTPAEALAGEQTTQNGNGDDAGE